MILLLLVEDEPAIRTMLEDSLAEEGFKLVLARDGSQALAELDADAARFRGVVTDISLGRGPTGWEVARRARELVPEMPIIYMTGGNAHEWAAQGVPKSVLVPKPFVPAQIITAVSNLLNGGETS
jgi:DNA-binding response OmpR family regulator